MNITTISGEEIAKSKARKIKDPKGEWKYYKIGNINIKDSGDCYQINNIYYTIDKGRIVWDHTVCRYVLKTSVVFGIINERLEEGHFSLNDNCIFLIISKEIKKHCLNKTIAENLNYINGESNYYYNPDNFTYSEIYPRYNVSSDYKNSLQYNFKNYLENCKSKYLSFKPKISEEVEYFYSQCPRLLDTYTFGVELETTRGMIPESVYKTLGVMPVRDGSITGLEYVTIPLNGKKGLYALKEIVEAVIKYTDSDYTCSMHIHVGNIPRSMEFIVAMFKFGYYFQDEVFKLFPGYKRSNDNIKRQCYTAPLSSLLMSKLNYSCSTLEDVKNDYKNIVHELSGKNENYRSFIDLKDIHNHPSDPSESAKWGMKERYKFLNLIPLIFTNKQTIEYRIFTVPDTVEKAFHFLMMSLLMTDFVISKQKLILTFPEKIYQYRLNDINAMLTDSSLISYLNRDRENVVTGYVARKGSFFEEKDIFLPSRVFKNRKQSKKDVHFYDLEDTPVQGLSQEQILERLRMQGSSIFRNSTYGTTNRTLNNTENTETIRPIPRRNGRNI